jgi:acyl carrier protein
VNGTVGIGTGTAVRHRRAWRIWSSHQATAQTENDHSDAKRQEKRDFSSVGGNRHTQSKVKPAAPQARQGGNNNNPSKAWQEQKMKPCLPILLKIVETGRMTACVDVFRHIHESLSPNHKILETVMPSKEEVFKGVQEALVEALAVDEDEVTPEATLVGDLGAESIDLLDIVYRLEKNFSIKIERGELVPDDIVNDQTEKYVSKDGKLTDAGLAEIKKRMPYANLESFEKNPAVANLTTILTVRDMCYIVEMKLGLA